MMASGSGQLAKVSGCWTVFIHRTVSFRHFSADLGVPLT
jgi:hypothetical protein